MVIQNIITNFVSMIPISPTPIKFDEDLKKAIKEYADKNYLGNLSMVVKVATIKLIKYTPKKSA